jgi:hypothetical protein
MEQLGCLLLGFTFAIPGALFIRALATWIGQPNGAKPGDETRGDSAFPLPEQANAIDEYFSSRSARPSNPAQLLSVAELTDSLGGDGSDDSPSRVRFDAEGGYQLRL